MWWEWLVGWASAFPRAPTAPWDADPQGQEGVGLVTSPRGLRHQAWWPPPPRPEPRSGGDSAGGIGVPTCPGGGHGPQRVTHSLHPLTREGPDAPVSSRAQPCPTSWAAPVPRLPSAGCAHSPALPSSVPPRLCLPPCRRVRSTRPDFHRLRSAPGTIFALGESQTFILSFIQGVAVKHKRPHYATSFPGSGSVQGRGRGPGRGSGLPPACALPPHGVGTPEARVGAAPEAGPSRMGGGPAGERPPLPGPSPPGLTEEPGHLGPHRPLPARLAGASPGPVQAWGGGGRSWRWVGGGLDRPHLHTSPSLSPASPRLGLSGRFSVAAPGPTPPGLRTAPRGPRPHSLLVCMSPLASWLRRATGASGGRPLWPARGFVALASSTPEPLRRHRTFRKLWRKLSERKP